MMRKLFLFAFVLLFVTNGESLRCYVCRSDLNDKCSSDTRYIQECSANHSYCRKIVQKLVFKEEKESTSIRECAGEKGEEDCYVLKWLEILHQETCECDSDACNRGSRHFPKVFLLLLLFLLGMYLIG